MSISEWASRLNKLASSVGGANHLINFNPENLMELAKASTQLSDFGDEGWQQRYYRYCADLQITEFSLTGLLLTKSRLLRALRNRLLVIDEMKQKPSISTQKILNPVFVTGAARTGTSILFEVLARDPRFRAPLTWEAICPTPLRPHMVFDDITEIEIAKNERNLFVDIAPEFPQLHELGWNIPVECHELMEPSFAGIKNDNKDDVSSRYQWHKTILQVLQHEKEPKQWLLKCGHHLSALDELFKVYPDAIVINTHRDPLHSISSMLYMGSVSAEMLYKNTNKNYFGSIDSILDEFERSRRNLILMRKEKKFSERIHDINYHEFIEDPAKAIRNLYERMGFDYKDEMDSLIQDYLSRKPSNKARKESRYSIHYEGLREKINKRLGFYIDHYSIPVGN